MTEKGMDRVKSRANGAKQNRVLPEQSEVYSSKRVSARSAKRRWGTKGSAKTGRSVGEKRTTSALWGKWAVEEEGKLYIERQALRCTT